MFVPWWQIVLPCDHLCLQKQRLHFQPSSGLSSIVSRMSTVLHKPSSGHALDVSNAFLFRFLLPISAISTSLFGNKAAYILSSHGDHVDA